MILDYEMKVTFLYGTQEVTMKVDKPPEEIDFSKPMSIRDQSGTIIFINLNNATSVEYRKIR